jgi:hypothetical protein
MFANIQSKDEVRQDLYLHKEGGHEKMKAEIRVMLLKAEESPEALQAVRGKDWSEYGPTNMLIPNLWPPEILSHQF